MKYRSIFSFNFSFFFFLKNESENFLQGLGVARPQKLPSKNDVKVKTLGGFLLTSAPRPSALSAPAKSTNRKEGRNPGDRRVCDGETVVVN